MQLKITLNYLISGLPELALVKHYLSKIFIVEVIEPLTMKLEQGWIRPYNVLENYHTLQNWRAYAGNFTCSSQVKKPHAQFTCVTCSLPVKTGKYTCFYAASTSRRIHAIARNKARKLRVTSPAGCRLTYLQFAGEFTGGVMADCLQPHLTLPEYNRYFTGNFTCGICANLPATSM